MVTRKKRSFVIPPPPNALFYMIAWTSLGWCAARLWGAL
jgi:hypothetical protein